MVCLYQGRRGKPVVVKRFCSAVKSASFSAFKEVEAIFPVAILSDKVVADDSNLTSEF